MSKLLMIQGQGVNVSYRIRFSGKAENAEVGGASIQLDDKVTRLADGSYEATGTVRGGKDAIRYEGEIVSTFIEGVVELTVSNDSSSTSLAPAGFEPVAPISNGTWIQRHPTRYAWRPDVEELIWKLYDLGLSVHINTYVDHPEGYARDVDSLDIWGWAGRGSPVGRETGQQAADYIFYKQPLWIDWIIWRGQVYSYWSKKWQPFNDDGTGLHYDHVHVTFLR